MPHLHISLEDQTHAKQAVQIPESSRNYIGVLLNAFLPAGYPQSVTEDYLEYGHWSFRFYEASF
jgi:hypothetical protein